MEYKGTLSIVGDNGDPLPVLCRVSEHRLSISTPDGAEIGDWGIREIGIQPDGDSVVIRAEGETLRLNVDRPDALASALHLDDSTRITDRVTAARHSPSSTARSRWPIIAAATATLIILGLGSAAVLGVAPFNRSNPIEAAPNAAGTPTTVSTSSPPTTSPSPPTTRPLTLLEQNLMLRDIWLTYMQDNPAGIVGYWTRATEASGNRDWATMGAECKLGASTNQHWRTIIAATPIRPEPAYSQIQAFADEIDLMFFWCSGGDQYASEAASAHYGVAYELLLRINDEFGIDMEE